MTQIQKGLALMDRLLEQDTAKVSVARSGCFPSFLHCHRHLQGKITNEEAKEARERITVVSPDKGLAGLQDVDMVIEVHTRVLVHFAL